MRNFGTHIKTRAKIYTVYLLTVPFVLFGMMFLTGRVFEHNHETIAMFIALTTSFYLAALIGAFSFKVIQSIRGFGVFSLTFIAALIIVGKLSQWFVLDSDIGIGKGITHWNFLVMGPILIAYSTICAVLIFELAWLVAFFASRSKVKVI